jgi:threonine synthase
VQAAGGELVLVDGSIADAGRKAKEIVDEEGGFLASTFSEPYRLEGKKAAWLEVFDRFGDEHGMRIPRTIVLPVGGGVAALAAAKAAEEVRALGWTTDDMPRLVGVQARNCAPLVKAFDEGGDGTEPWAEDPNTIAAGLRVPAPAEGPLVLRTVRQSRGLMWAVSESAIERAIRALAAREGIFACPEGAGAVAAVDQLCADDEDEEIEGPVLIYNTGSGIKYMDVLGQILDRPSPT